MAAPPATLQESRSQIEILITTLQTLPSSKISQSSKQTLIRLLSAELRYLFSISSAPPPSLNSGYFSAIISTILHPSVRSVTRVCKPVSSVHVDIVCTLNSTPSWFFVSDRNPNYIAWSIVKSRVQKVLSVAESVVVTKPESVVFLYSKGLNYEVGTRIKEEFGAVEIDVFKFGRAFEIKVPGGRSEVDISRSLGGVLENVYLGGDDFGRFVGLMRKDGDREVVNFDTTALVAMVSGISNGGCDRILNGNEMELRAKYKCNYEFVTTQVMSELEHPILKELKGFIAGRKGIICESVCTEFKELVLMCGGPNEKSRADRLIKHLLVVQDSPSERVAALPTTRKIALKSKIVFGTGDYWHAPTLTANMGFVRAIAQTGMSLFTIEHRPRALIGD